MAKTIENLFVILHFSVNILIIFLYIIFFRKIKHEKGFLAITCYCFLDSLLNLAVKYVNLNLSWRLYIWSTFTFVEYLTFTFVIWSTIKNAFVRRLIVYTSSFFIVFTTIYNIITNFKGIDSIPIGIETILILVFSFYYLYEQMNNTVDLFIYSTYQFWIIIGFMIYLAGSFFIYILASAMEQVLLNQYWLLTNAFYAIMIILFAISFFVFVKRSKPIIHKNLRPYLN
ncbi:MAG: hypothetical protein ACXVLT_05205 [Flavisolibacter sp.]